MGAQADQAEAELLYDKFLVAAPGSVMFQVACANLNPWSHASVDIKYRRRGPLLLISGGEDNMVPAAVTNAAFKLQRRNRGVTEIVEIENRGHSLTIDSGWREVAETVLAFITRFIWRRLDSQLHGNPQSTKAPISRSGHACAADIRPAESG